jgi:hypothetical protein
MDGISTLYGYYSLNSFNGIPRYKETKTKMDKKKKMKYRNEKERNKPENIFGFTVETLIKNLSQMGYPFSFGKIVEKEYMEIILGPSGKRVRFQSYPAQFVISNHDDIYNPFYRRSVSDIGYNPMEGLQHYDFYGLKSELMENSIFEPNIMQNIFYYVDFIFKDVTTYTISTKPELVPFESRIRTMFIEEGMRKLMYDIVMEIKEFYNPYEHFINYVIDLLQHQKLKEGETIDILIHPSYPLQHLIITPIDYTKTNLKGTFHRKMNIGQNESDLSPIGIAIYEEDKLLKKIQMDSRKDSPVLLYEDIEFFVTFYR